MITIEQFLNQNIFLLASPLVQVLTEAEAAEYEEFYNAPYEEETEDYREVFEYWFISSYLAEKLREHDEIVTDYLGVYNVWHRCTTGQSIAIDCVIEDIYNELIK